MKYKIDPIPRMPSWFQPGIVCKVTDLKKVWKEERTIVAFVHGLFLDTYNTSWPFAEPVEQWEPQEGEWVAAFVDGGTAYNVQKFPGHGVLYHVARL